MKKIITAFLFILIASYAVFETPKLVVRTVKEMAREFGAQGFFGFKNKVEFFSYFTSGIGGLKKDGFDVYRVSKRENTLLSNLHLGNYYFLISKAKQDESILDDESSLIYLKTACIRLLQKGLDDSFCEKKVFLKGETSLDFYLSSIYKYYSNKKGDNIDILNDYFPVLNGQSKNTVFKNPKNLLSNISAKGIAVEDYNLDGRLDIVTTNSYGEPRFLKNNGNLKFEPVDITELKSAYQAYYVTNIDYNNDGLIDLLFGCPFNTLKLYENLGQFKFKDVTKKIGSFNPDDNFYGTWHISVADVDKDGDLDFFVSSFGEPVPFGKGVFSKNFTDSKLYINQGKNLDYKFLDSTNEQFSDYSFKNKLFVSSSFYDYDLDGDKDFVVSDFTRTGLRLFNRGSNNKFKLRTDSGFINSPGYLHQFTHVNDDDFIDFFHAGNGQFKTIISNIMEKGYSLDSSSRVYEQQRNNQFKQIVNFFDKPTNFTVLGFAAEDFNNDGCLDLLLGTGNPEPWFIAPNLFYLGYKTENGCRVKLSQDFFPFQTKDNLLSKYQGVLSADFNNDGALDLLVASSGFWEGEKGSLSLYENSLSNSNFLSLRVRGKLNKYGIGKRIEVVTKNIDGFKNKKTYEINNSNGFGSSPYQLHVNLGGEKLEEVFVYWEKEGRQKYILKENKAYVLTKRGALVDRS